MSDSTIHERDVQRVSSVDAARKNNIVLSVTGKPSLPTTSATMASTRSKFIIQIFLTWVRIMEFIFALVLVLDSTQYNSNAAPRTGQLHQLVTAHSN